MEKLLPNVEDDCERDSEVMAPFINAIQRPLRNGLDVIESNVSACTLKPEMRIAINIELRADIKSNFFRKLR